MLDLTLALAALLAGPSWQSPQTATTTKLEDPDYLRVVVHGRSGLTDRLTGRGYDARTVPAIGRRREAAEVILDERDVPQLRRFAGNVLVLERSRPMNEILAQWTGPLDLPPDARYHTPAEIETDLLDLQTTYPNLAARIDLNTRYSVALTHEGRHIFALKISDNPGTDEDEPAILLVTNHHARELNTVELALHSANQLLALYATDPGIRKLVDENEIWIVPTMNPDGLSYVWTNNNMWRKNRRDNGNGRFGVDQNRNYPYFWSRCGSSASPNSSTYHGPSAGSEPETQVMLALGRAEVFERMLDVHSYSRDVRYGYNKLTGPNLPGPLKAFLDKIQAEVATAMRYRTNASCCCGGDQHWHFAENGTLSYLVEMDTAFQPAWSQTQTEVDRVFDGVRLFFEKPVPLRGHVQSLAGGTPLAAEIEIVGQPLGDGQRRRSSPRHGRYAVWVPTGTYDVRFRATGYEPRTLRIAVTEGRTVDRDVLLTPTMLPTTLAPRGTPRIGTTMFFDVSSPDDGGREYIVGAALGSHPGTPIGPRTVPLNADGLLASVAYLPTVFVNAFGSLSANGLGTMDFAIPNLPILAGLEIHFCGVTIDKTWPSSVKGISNPVAVRLKL